jgi:signal transduction histidine kinase
MSSPAMQDLRDQLNQLLDNAKTGNIIPIRLPAQVEAIIEAVDTVEADHKEALAKAMPEDMEGYMEEEAYFVGHAVHELRTPMTSIRGYSDMMGQMGELSDMQKQFLDVIKTNSRRMESLLKDMSYINKIRKNTLQLNPKMDMFKNMAMRLEKDMEKVAEEHKKELVFDVPDGLPLLNLDSEILVVAIEKMIENSLRYTNEDGKVTVSGSADGSTLVIQVTDNGIGISDEDMAKLGTIYFRSDHDLVREFKGSGLGIPIAYGLLDVLGATYSVESEVDKGTTFTVRIEGMT